MAESLESLSQRVEALETALNRLLGSQGNTTVRTADVTSEEWQALGDKLDKFESVLSDKEKAVMISVLGAAAATYERAGVREGPAGAARTPISLTGGLSRVKLSDTLISIGKFDKPGAGGFGGAGPVSDSVNVGGDFTSVHGDWTKDTGKSDAMIRGRWNAISQPGLGAVVAPAAGGGFGRSAGGGGF